MMKRCAGVLAMALVFVADGAFAQWRYETEVDRMTGKETRYALTISTNSLDLPFPYKGTNHGQLTVRQHPKYGLDVIVSVDKGQILCRSYDGCTIAVKFDSAAPVRFSASASADHDPKVIFLDSEQRFIAAAKKAKSILVQISMFQAGEQILEFSTGTPLEWGGKVKR